MTLSALYCRIYGSEFAPLACGAAQITAERFLNLRYDGTDVAVMIRTPEDGNFRNAFDAEYRWGSCPVQPGAGKALGCLDISRA